MASLVMLGIQKKCDTWNDLLKMDMSHYTAAQWALGAWPMEKRGEMSVLVCTSHSTAEPSSSVCLPAFAFDLAHHDAFPAEVTHAAPSYIPWFRLSSCSRARCLSIGPNSTPIEQRAYVPNTQNVC